MTTRNTPTDESEPTLEAGTQDANESERSSRAAASGARMPSVSSMVRYMSPDAIAERRRRARENFGRVTPVPNGVAKAPDDSAQIAANAPPAARVSAPSPWARSQGGEIDKAALPSAAMPVVPPTSSDVAPSPERRRGMGSGASVRRNMWPIVAVCAAVAVTAPIVVVVAGSTRKPIEQPGNGSAAASARAVATTMPSASAPTPAASSTAPAPAVSSAAPTVHEEPSSVPAVSTVRPAPAPARTQAPPIRTAAPTEDAGQPAPPAPPKPKGNDDPILNE